MAQNHQKSPKNQKWPSWPKTTTMKINDPNGQRWS
jgi:hypothetical protein